MVTKTEFPRGNTELSKDKRPIREIYSTAAGSSFGAVTGERGVTEIVPYDESGHMACIPWIAVMVGDRCWIRMPAETVVIHYF
jgi:hypothetical protein